MDKGLKNGQKTPKFSLAVALRIPGCPFGSVLEVSPRRDAHWRGAGYDTDFFTSVSGRRYSAHARR